MNCSFPTLHYLGHLLNNQFVLLVPNVCWQGANSPRNYLFIIVIEYREKRSYQLIVKRKMVFLYWYLQVREKMFQIYIASISLWFCYKIIESCEQQFINVSLITMHSNWCQLLSPCFLNHFWQMEPFGNLPRCERLDSHYQHLFKNILSYYFILKFTKRIKL